MRERFVDPGAVKLVGFTTHRGRVAAASDWDEPVEHKAVRPSLPGSIERVLHDSGGDFVVPSTGLPDGPLLERAIGVVYRPETERASHYFHAHVARQFDLLIHFDETRAVTPLDPADAWVSHEEPETYPTGM